MVALIFSKKILDKNAINVLGRVDARPWPWRAIIVAHARSRSQEKISKKNKKYFFPKVLDNANLWV
jgi:hypothetical protein